MLDFEQLRALHAAVDEGTFEAAARKLHITPSAVSQRIKALETSVGRIDRQEAADESGRHEIDSRRLRFAAGHRLDVLDAASLCEGDSSDDDRGGSSRSDSRNTRAREARPPLHRQRHRASPTPGSIPVGDHTLVIGLVTRVHAEEDDESAAAPLLYHEGKYYRPTPLGQ